MPRKKVGDQILEGVATAVPSFLNSFYQARKFANDERQQGVDNDLARGKMGLQHGQLENARANTNLRGQEITKDYAMEGGRNARTAASNRLAVFKNLSGGQGQHAPEEYAGALGALESGDAAAFGQALTMARNLASQNKVKEAGRTAGVRSAATASAKSNQKRRDSIDMDATTRLRAGELSEMPEGTREFPVVRTAGKPQEELIADDRRKRAHKAIDRLGKLQDKNEPITREVAREAAMGHLSMQLNPEDFRELAGASPEERNAILDENIKSRGWELID